MSDSKHLMGKQLAAQQIKPVQAPGSRKKASLLSLPPEIRLAIFAYALRAKGGIVCIRIRGKKRLLLTYETIRAEVLSHPLFHVGHSRIVNEAMESFVVTNNFRPCDENSTQFLQRLLSNSLGHTDDTNIFLPLCLIWLQRFLST